MRKGMLPSTSADVTAAARNGSRQTHRTIPGVKMLAVCLTIAATMAGGLILAPLARADGVAIATKYQQLGGPTGPLGPVVSGEGETPDHAAHYVTYRFGSIYSWSGGTFEIHGAIRDKWAQQGYERGPLGYPTTDERVTPDHIGRYNHFEHGSIYWTPATNAHSVEEPVRAKWAVQGWEQGPLGYPISDYGSTPDRLGHYNHFQNGSIYWTAKTQAHIISGPILYKWIELKWERGPLGYPVTDERIAPDHVGRYMHFQNNRGQNGSIYWTPETGAHEVYGAIRDQWARIGWEKSYMGYPVTGELPAANGGRFNVFQNGTIYYSTRTGPRLGYLAWPPGLVKV